MPDPKLPVSPGNCEIVDPPPELANGSDSDYGKPGDPGCGLEWEVCLSVKAAKHYVALQMWADESFSRCQKR